MQVAKVCIVGCFAVSRFARIGLIVLALAITVVGMGAVGMAFLPAAVTEPVVKPVIQSVELLTGCLLYTSPSPRDRTRSRMPSSA